MRQSPVQIAFKALGTVALAAGFLVLVGRTPFLSGEDQGRPVAGKKMPSSAGAVTSKLQLPNLQLPNLNLDPGTYPSTDSLGLLPNGALPPAPFPALKTASRGAPLEPTMGLFKARFNESAVSSGFATEEHRVPGRCDGAGDRYLNDVCPTCQVTRGNALNGMPAMLMWSQFEDDESVFRAVTRDCMFISPDGLSVVGSLRFGSGLADLRNQTADLALDIVPLLPGSTRIAAVEEGGWLATFDEIGRPSTALADMATQLRNRGWHDTPSEVEEDRLNFEGQRVFTNDTQAFCVISLSRKGNTHQLLTVMDSKAGG